MLFLSDQLYVASGKGKQNELPQNEFIESAPTTHETAYTVVVKTLCLLLEPEALKEACLGEKGSTARRLALQWVHVSKDLRREELVEFCKRNVNAIFTDKARKEPDVRHFDIRTEAIEPTLARALSVMQLEVNLGDFPWREGIKKLLPNMTGPDAERVKQILNEYSGDASGSGQK